MTKQVQHYLTHMVTAVMGRVDGKPVLYQRKEKLPIECKNTRM